MQSGLIGKEGFILTITMLMASLDIPAAECVAIKKEGCSRESEIFLGQMKKEK